MKYKAGDKFIIEIESRVNSQGLYKVKGFRTLVFDDNGLDRLKQHHERLACCDCKYEEVSSVEYPCSSCSNVYSSRWEPKTEEIQVGDEVDLWGQRGVAMNTGRFVTVLDSEFDKHVWNSEHCKRTGKTYPELIKVLEQLPKDGE